jgi:glutamyl-tRNA synthetase
LADEQSVSFGVIAQLLGSALIGRKNTPGLYVVLMALGREEALRRIDRVLAEAATR